MQDKSAVGWFEHFEQGVQKLNRWIAGVGAIFLIPLMLITTCEVIGRNLFNRPIAGTIELSEYMLSVFILLGLAYLQQVKAHVGVSFVTSRLSPYAQFMLNTITTLISLFIFFILTWQGLAVGFKERTVSDMLRIPQYPFRLLVAVAAFFTCLELLIDFEKAIRRRLRRSS